MATTLADFSSTVQPGTNVTTATTTNLVTVTRGFLSTTGLRVAISLSNAGATAVSGTWAFQVQGSNDGSTWTNVNPDKGSSGSINPAGTQDSAGRPAFTTLTAAGSLIGHLAQTFFAQYRLQVVTTGTVVGMVSAVFDLFPLRDTFNATCQ